MNKMIMNTPMSQIYHPWGDDKTLGDYLEGMEKENKLLKSYIKDLEQENKELDFTCDELIKQLKMATGTDHFIGIEPVRETEYDRRPLEYLINDCLVDLAITPDIWDVEEIALLAEATVSQLADFLEKTFGEDDLVNKFDIYELASDEAVRKKARDIMLSIALKGDIEKRYGLKVKEMSYEEYYKES